GMIRISAVDAEAAGRGTNPPNEAAQERGLARPIGTEKAQNLPGPDLQSDPVQGSARAERLDDISDLERKGFGHAGIIREKVFGVRSSVFGTITDSPITDNR